MKINVPGRSTNGKGSSTSRGRFDLLRRGQNEKKSRGVRSSVRLFFFICLLVAGFAGRVFSQDLGTLAEQLHSGSAEEKRTALMQLRSLRSEEASRVAVAGLKDKNPMVRATAASSVTFLTSAEAASALLPLLGDKDEFVRKEGAYALGVDG